jgi:hypothetical protein
MKTISTLYLFRALPIKTKRKKKVSKSLLNKIIKKKVSKSLLNKTIKYGFVFSPEVVYNYSEEELINIIKIIKSELGVTPEQLNSSFHKSWNKIKNTDIEQLVIEQLIHYFTTYGFEKLGIYDKNSVYIPREKLEIPEVDIDKFNFVVIKGYTKKELKEKLLNMLQSGIALNEDTIEYIIDVAKFVDITIQEVENIKNKEVRIILYKHLNVIPEAPIELLRYIIYEITGSSLLIKNNFTIETIKDNVYTDSNNIRLFQKYCTYYDFNKLAEIFYRFKPLFLAFRSHNDLRPVINKIRRLAIKNHKPMKEDYLNSITSHIKKGETIDRKKLESELDKTNIFRKIRLGYALKFRTKENESILYKIRNNKSFATTFSFKSYDKAKKVLGIVTDSIIKDISKNVKGKKIYIPDYIEYALPSTEKQFTGYFPSGTCISLPSDMIFGIHWDNVDNNRIDLDLSTINIDNEKFGWDGSYRNSDRTILFSGDMTDAQKPSGATELFYVRKQLQNSFLLFVNYFNHDENIEVPFKIIVAKEKISSFGKNYMVNPNNIVSIANSKIKEKQKVLGFVKVTTKTSKFYFAEINLGQSISSSDNEYTKHTIKYFNNFFSNTISFNSILEKSGAIITRDKENYDLDLSPENLEKDTILNLIRRK